MGWWFGRKSAPAGRGFVPSFLLGEESEKGFARGVEGMRFCEPTTGIELAYRGGAWVTGSIRAIEIVIGGNKVLGARQPAIASPVGGGVIDVEGRSIINQILAAIGTHGLIEP